MTSDDNDDNTLPLSLIRSTATASVNEPEPARPPLNLLLSLAFQASSCGLWALQLWWGMIPARWGSGGSMPLLIG